MLVKWIKEMGTIFELTYLFDQNRAIATKWPCENGSHNDLIGRKACLLVGGVMNTCQLFYLCRLTQCYCFHAGFIVHVTTRLTMWVRYRTDSIKLSLLFLAHLNWRLKVRYSDRLSSVPCLFVTFFFKWNLLLNHWSKFHITSHECSPWCPLPKLHNTRATRAPDKKSFKQHLLNHWPKFEINSQNCFS